MRLHLYALALFIPSIAFTQESPSPKSEIIRLSVGRSFHGTGDMKGISTDLDYVMRLGKRIDLSSGLGTTIHYRTENISNPENSLHFVTAGIQLVPQIEFRVIGSADQSIKLIAGGLARFQSTSYPTVYSYSPPDMYNPYPSYSIIESGKQNVFSVGFTAGLSYMFALSNKWEMGTKAMFQSDTNGDAITHISIIVGRIVR